MDRKNLVHQYNIMYKLFLIWLELKMHLAGDFFTEKNSDDVIWKIPYQSVLINYGIKKSEILNS